MDYYPIGTVVILKGGNRPVMIYGRKQQQLSSGLTWDYVAFLYPEGNLGEDYNVFFQQVEIEKVIHLGLYSEADEKMQKLLNQVPLMSNHAQ